MVAIDDGFPYMESVVVFHVLVYLFHSYLDLRQYKAIKLPEPPAAIAKFYEKDSYRKTQEYNVDKWWFRTVHGLYDAIEGNALILYGWLPFLWHVSGSLLSRLGYQGEILQTIVFFLLESAKDLVEGLPWEVYGTFVIEERHGFNKQTMQLFLVDKVKGVLLGLALGPPIIAAITWILKHTGPYFALYLWGFLCCLTLVMVPFYANVIAPLFNKFTALDEGSLRQKIEALAGSLRFPLTKLYVIDGSTRSAHSNAYMYGFFKSKRIVLFDTLLEQCSEEEVVSVLAHELGHWKLWHTPLNFGIGQVQLLATLGLFTFVRNSGPLFESFGFHDERPAFIAFILFQFIFAPVNEVLGFFMNVLSRKFEFQADRFAVDLGHSLQLKEALLKLDQKNRSATNVDAWYSAYHYSHPPLVERLKAIDTATKKED